MRFALVDDRCDVGFMSNYSRLQATITRRTAMPAQTYDVWTFRHLVNVPCFAGVFVVFFSSYIYLSCHCSNNFKIFNRRRIRRVSCRITAENAENRSCDRRLFVFPAAVETSIVFINSLISWFVSISYSRWDPKSRFC